jgi:cytidylate kinase
MSSFEAVVESHVKRWITGERLVRRIHREREKMTKTLPSPPSLTLSCAYGSGGEAVAQRLSQALGYQIFDKEIMEAVSSSAKATTRIIEALDAGNRKEIASLVDQLFSRRVITDTSYFRSLVKVVRFIAHLGPAIFIGRGACHILRDTGSFNLRICAAFEDRVTRIMVEEGVSEMEAERKVAEQDRMHRGFIKGHFDRDINDPTGYHLTVNTSCIPPARTSDFVQNLYRDMIRSAP